MHFILVTLLLSLAAISHGQDDLVCEEIAGCTADIALLVDKSGSITQPRDGGDPGNWKILKEFIYAVMDSSKFGTPEDEGALYSVLFFANNANLKVNLNTCKDMQCVRDIVERVNPPGGRTNTNAALQSALNDIFVPSGGDRADAPDIIILVTDGKPNPYNQAELDATVSAVKAKGIRIVGVGVGKGVDDDIMRSIVTAPASENYFQITSFAAIAAQLDDILRKACIVCRVAPCWNDWGEWGACSVTCEDGVSTRTRTPRGERQCEGPSEETRPCTGPTCECYGAWSDWSSCPVTCGSGIETRNRSPLGERQCEEPALESRPCTLRECPCYGEWLEWSSCPVTCGGGIERRVRPALQNNCPDTTEDRPCAPSSCPCYGEWLEWSSCPVTCGGGIERRVRPALRENCPDTTEDRSCAQSDCPCFGEWGDWGSCSATCEGGTETRQRQRLSEEARCEGQTEESRSCGEGKCGCDPKTINFYTAASNLEEQKGFNFDSLMGSWYWVRWYVPQSANVSGEYYDPSIYIYKKAGYEDRVFWNFYLRDKLADCCSDRLESHSLLEGEASTRWSAYGEDYKSTIVYSNKHIMVDVRCHLKEHNTCSDYSVVFWSRCKEPRDQDMCKGEEALRKICYPHMKRYIDAKHKMDCHQDYHEECGCERDHKYSGYRKNKCGSKKCDKEDDEDDNDRYQKEHDYDHERRRKYY